MYRRVTEDAQRLTLAEEVRMEDLWTRLVSVGRELVRHKEDLNGVEFEAFEEQLNTGEAFTYQLTARRKLLPEHIPDRFILIKQPMPISREFDEGIEYMTLARNEYGQLDRFATAKPKRWPYNDYSTHPIRHVRPFAKRAEQALSWAHVYAVIVADPRRKFSYCHLDKLIDQFSHSLVYDWAQPVNWFIDLFNYSVVQGPYTDQCAYDVYHKRGGLMCLRWNQSREWHQNYEDAKLERVVYGRFLLHLVPPYGKLLNEE